MTNKLLNGGHRAMQALPAAVVAFIAVVQAWVLSGCSTQTCADNRSAVPQAGFYSSATGETIILDSLEVGGVGAPNDSLLMKPGESGYSLYLPFRFEAAETSFFFHYDYKENSLADPAFNDTITFRYTTVPFFASEECGAFYVYHIDGVDYTTHLIDSVVVMDKVINNVDLERIRVYFRTAEDGGGEEPTPDSGAEGEKGGEGR